MPLDNMMVFTGNANPDLAKSIVTNLDMPLGEAKVGRFSDGEIAVEINQNVRGKDVFIVQSTNSPCNRNLMELLVIIDALRRSSAQRITAVIPYYGYARQDRRPRSSRVPISAKLVASMIVTAGANRVLTMDLHADQIQGFFDIPTDNIYGSPVLLNHMRDNVAKNAVVVSPDIGGVVRARAFSKYMNSELAIIDKRRPKANVAEVMNIIGDVEGRECVLVDDMVDTANTLCKAAEALKARGAQKVHAYATHAVLSGEAVERINKSVLDSVVLTNTISLRADVAESSKIQIVCVARIIAESMRRVATEDSVSSLFLH